MKKSIPLKNCELSLFLLLVITVVMMLIYVFNIEAIFHSDLATASLLAHEQSVTGQFFPETWCYAQDIWTISTHSVIYVLSFIMTDVMLMREIASLVFVALPAIVIILYHHQILHSRAWLISLTLILTCCESEAYHYSAHQGYFSILMYLLLGLFLYSKAISVDFKIKSKLSFALLLVLIIYLILKGTRYLAALIIPLLGAIVLIFAIENYNKQLKEIKEHLIRLILVISSVAVAVLIGLLCFNLIQSNIYFNTGATALAFTGLSEISKNISILVSNILYIIGVKQGVGLFTFWGVVNVAKVLLTILLCIVFPYQLFKKYEEQSYDVKLLMVFTLIHIGINVFIVVFMSGMTTARYMLSSVYLLYILSGFYIYKYLFNKGFIMNAAVIISILVFTVSGALEVNNIRIQSQNNAVTEKQFLAFMDEHDLEYGYATYWNAYKHTVFSEFDVQINGINVYNNGIEPFYWLTSTRWYEPEFYQGDTFLLLTESEYNLIVNSEEVQNFGTPKEVLRYGSYIFLKYNYNIAEKAWS